MYLDKPIKIPTELYACNWRSYLNIAFSCGTCNGSPLHFFLCKCYVGYHFSNYVHFVPHIRC